MAQKFSPIKRPFAFHHSWEKCLTDMHHLTQCQAAINYWGARRSNSWVGSLIKCLAWSWAKWLPSFYLSCCRAAISRHTTRNTTGSTSTDEGHHQSLTGEDRRMAIVLFSIVVLYMVCNTPRLILNFYEFFSIDLFRRNPNLCFRMPTWVEVMTSVNLVIITFNSSVNYFIYCACNTTFREEQSARWAAFKDKYFQNWPASLATLVTFGRGDQEDVQGGQAVAFSRRRTITNQGSGGGASSGIRVLHSHPDLGNDLENCVLMPPEQSGQKFREQGCQEPPP